MSHGISPALHLGERRLRGIMGRTPLAVYGISFLKNQTKYTQSAKIVKPFFICTACCMAIALLKAAILYNNWP